MKTHYTEEIVRDHEHLPADAARHAASCRLCAREVRRMRQITRAAGALPESPVPAELRQRVMQSLPMPAVRIWHVLLALGGLFAGPVLYYLFLEPQDILALGPGQQMGISVLFGMISAGLVLPLAYLFMQNHLFLISQVQHQLDALLAHPPHMPRIRRGATHKH